MRYSIGGHGGRTITWSSTPRLPHIQTLDLENFYNCAVSSVLTYGFLVQFTCCIKVDRPGLKKKCLPTCSPSSSDTLSSVMSGRLSISVAILNASCASLKMWDEEWMFFWMDSSTVSSLRLSPGRRRGEI